MKKFTIALICSILIAKTYSQITFYQVKKDSVVAQINNIIQPYDSLNPIKIYKGKDAYQNKKYVGQKIFLNGVDKLYTLNITKSRLSDSKFARRIMDGSFPYLNKYPNAEIWTCIYKPVEIIKEYGGYMKYIDYQTSSVVLNRYFTITNFYDSINNIVKFKTVNQVFNTGVRNLYNHGRRDSIITEFQEFKGNFELIDDLTGDTVYVDDLDGFISTAYFLKLKSLFENKSYIYVPEFIRDGNTYIEDPITNKKYLKDSINGKLFTAKVNLHNYEPYISFENKNAIISYAIIDENSYIPKIHKTYSDFFNKSTPRLFKQCSTIDSLHSEIYKKTMNSPSITNYDSIVLNNTEYQNELNSHQYEYKFNYLNLNDFIPINEFNLINNKLDSIILAKKTVLSKYSKFLVQRKIEREEIEKLKIIEAENYKIKSIEAEKERKNRLTQRFGSKFGLLVAKGVIEIGMNKEMVKEVFGAFYTVVQKTNTNKGIVEIWYSSPWKKKVFFLNNTVYSVQIVN
jgi:hypothetical protein